MDHLLEILTPAKWLIWLSQLESFGRIRFGKFRRAARLNHFISIQVGRLSHQKSLVSTLYDQGQFMAGKSSYFGFKTPRSSFHRNEWGLVFNTVWDLNRSSSASSLSGAARSPDRELITPKKCWCLHCKHTMSGPVWAEAIRLAYWTWFAPQYICHGVKTVILSNSVDNCWLVRFLMSPNRGHTSSI